MTDDSRMRDLIVELGDADKSLAEFAEAELRDEYGPLIVDALLEAMPGFGSFGILSAIELLEEFGDERAGPILISLLDHEEHVVREWAARALGALAIRDAIEPLKLAYERVKARRTPLDWTEPVAIRGALTRLGEREEVLPPSVQRLQRSDPTMGRYWELADATEVIDALADARQAIVSVMAWEPGHIPLPGSEPDWSLPWLVLVEQTRRRAKAALSSPDVPHDAVVTLVWMSENDL